MSKSAKAIDGALQLYRECENTPAQELAFNNLRRTVERVKNCCGGRCRWCAEWRK